MSFEFIHLVSAFIKSTGLSTTALEIGDLVGLHGHGFALAGDIDFILTGGQAEIIRAVRIDQLGFAAGFEDANSRAAAGLHPQHAHEHPCVMPRLHLHAVNAFAADGEGVHARHQFSAEAAVGIDHFFLIIAGLDNADPRAAGIGILGEHNHDATQAALEISAGHDLKCRR